MAKRKYETSRRTNLRDVHTFDQPCQALMSAMGGNGTFAPGARKLHSRLFRLEACP